MQANSGATGYHRAVEWIPDIAVALAVVYGLFVAGMTTVNWVRFRRRIRRGPTEPVGA